MVAPDRTPPHQTAAPTIRRMVMVVDTGTPEAAQMADQVARLEGYGAELVPADRAPDVLLHAQGFAAILVGLDTLSRPEIRLIENLRASHPDVPLIVVSAPPDALQVRNLVQLGVQDWLQTPVDPDALAEALGREVRRPSRGTARVHAVLPAVAGAGGTSLAVTLADLIANEIARPNETVGLVDLDFTLAACAYRLNLQSGFPLDSVIIDPRRIDAELVALIRQRHARGFQVYSYASRALVTHVNCYEFVLRLLDVLASEHDYLVLDLPYHETDWRHDILMAVDSITLVSELNLPSIKHTMDMVQELASIQRAPAMTRVLLNKDHRSLFGRHRIDATTLQKLFGQTPFDFLPEDAEMLSEAMDRGIPPTEVDPASGFVKGVRAHLRGHLMTAPKLATG